MRAIRRLLSMRRPRRGEDGYVLATAVAVSFIVIMTVTAVVTIQIANIEATRRSIGQQQSRAAGESALDQAYLKFLNALQDNPLAVPSSLASGIDAVSWNWYQADQPTVICDDATEVCFHIEVDGSDNDYLLEVTSRSRCVGGTLNTVNGSYNGSGARCIVTKYQQRIRKKQFFDYLHFTNRETISPDWVKRGDWPGYSGTTNPPPPVAYAKGDDLDGVVRTNDRFWVCVGGSGGGANPIFRQGLFAVDESLGAPGGCSPNPQVTDETRNPSSTGTAQEVSRLDFPDSTELAKLEAISTGMGLHQDSATRITFSVVDGVGRYMIGSGSTKPLPKNAVFFFDNTVTVSGTVKGNVTVATAADSDIKVDGDLLYACRDKAAMQLGGETANCTDSLGLIAGNNIQIACSSSGDQEISPKFDNDGEAEKTGRCAPPNGGRYLVGALLALGQGDQGTIATQRWATADPVVPLYFYGSTASNYRPVWGLASADDATAVRGLRKIFTFDAGLKNRQPPSFLEPSNAPWERIDLIEVAPCAAGINGPPLGAGCP